MAVINLSVSGEPIVHDAHGSLITTRLDTGSGAIGTTGDNVGVTATWLNSGTYNGQPISLRATILSVGDANDCVGFDTLGDDFIVFLTTNGSAENRTAATAVIKWDVLDADTKTPISGNVNVQIGDIDGIDGVASTRETVTASQDSLSSFTTSSSTSILISAANNLVSASGTENNTISPAPSNSYVGFTFSDTSSFIVTYTLAANSVTEQALFTHDGDFDISISGAVITSTPRIDLDGDNSSGPTGADFAARFVQGLARAAIVDTDVTITSTGNLTGATVVLTNRQAGDDLAIGVLPTGITGTVDASDPAKVTVQLTGTASAADYQTALQAITFSNGSASGGEGIRAFEVSVAQNGIEGNVAKTALSVAPNLLLVDDTYAGIEDTLLLIDVLKNDTDADGDTLTITAINGIAIQPNNFVNIAGGRITLDPSGVLIFQPTVNSVTAPSFTYTVSDGQGHIAIASVNGTMTAVNDAPSSSSLSFSFSEDQSQIISVPHRDVDNDVLTITKINSTDVSIDGSSVVIASGVITLNLAGNIIFTPTANYSGPYT
ncbi:Ig-like domain-containing protein, partial [Xanthobacter sp. DSM 24535]|uniref:Ig-like domain-containing protein n=1 Tax=Roseixanthobacter psychrophilus TaxID=3119917 RepID=UPI00372B7722